MLAVISGPSPERAAAAQKLISSEAKKGNESVDFSDASFKKEAVLAYAGGSDMFGRSYVVRLSRVAESAEGLEFLLNHALALSESKTLYIVEENELSKELKSALDSVGAEVKEFKSAKSNDFFNKLNAFSLVDAYNIRDKKSAWVIYTKLIESETTAEEITGAMIWNFKNLALYHAGALAAKPFVLNKVSAAARKFSHQEVAARSYELTSLLHKFHRGQGDSSVLLELFILKSL